MGMWNALTSMFKSVVPTQEGYIDQGWPINYWQHDMRPVRYGLNSVVEACIDTLAQTVAQCPVQHWRLDGKGGQVEVLDSVASRIMHRPNSYQTRSDLFLNAVHSLYKEGNAYIYAGDRTQRGQIAALHLMNPHSCRGFVVPESYDVFYAASQGGWDIPDLDVSSLGYIPSRDMVHLRLHTPDDPLRGVTPMRAAAASVAANNSISYNQASFFANMSRPSGIIATEEKFTTDQMKQMREAWESQSTGMNSGKIPILSSGLKWYPLSITSQDAQLVDALRYTVEDITRVFRVPLPLVNAMNNQTFNNAEAMLNWWLASGLGFLLDHIELALNHVFALERGEYLNFDTDVLLRSDLKTKISALGEAVMKTVLSPNEARAKMRMPAVTDGEEPRAQQQVVPLSYYRERLELDKEKNDIARIQAEKKPTEPLALPPPDDAPDEPPPPDKAVIETTLYSKMGAYRV